MITDRFKPPGEKARAASDAGKLKLVREQTCQPYDGYGFTLDKGQVLRYELTDGPQVIDCTYLVRSRPVEEWADAWHTGIFSALTLHEGMHFISNTPYGRPLLTIIKDTVDYENLEKLYGRGPLTASSSRRGDAPRASGSWASVSSTRTAATPASSRGSSRSPVKTWPGRCGGPPGSSCTSSA